MVFNPTIINNTTPAVSITVENAGSNPVTYQQIVNSLGAHNYNVKNLFLYSPQYQQFAGTITYNIYDVNGNQSAYPITSALDTYQNQPAINIDLTNYKTPVIFNGLSSLSATILPNNSVQVIFGTERITNGGFLTLFNFQHLNKVAGTDLYAGNYGDDMVDIMNTNSLIQQGQAAVVPNGQRQPSISFAGQQKGNKSPKRSKVVLTNTGTQNLSTQHILFAMMVIVGVALYMEE